MTSSQTPDPTGGRARPHAKPDPLSMTAAEKAIAEWEARHDCAARGSRATPGAIQLYLAESRLRDLRREEERQRADRERTRRSHHKPVPEDHWWYLRLK
jgi:hypothetical protein